MSHTFLRHAAIFALAVGVGGVSVPARAATILFDFQGDSGGGSHQGTTAPGAVQVFDLASPVNGTFGNATITLTASTGNTVANSRNRGANTGPASDITRDFIQWPTATAISITISGLAASQEYEFTIWSGDLAGGQIKTTDHTIAGASGGGTIQHTSVSLAAENAAIGTSLLQVNLPNVFSTAGGNLTYTIDYVSGGGAAATLNGMQIVPVPEPSSLALVGLCGVGLYVLRRRTRMIA